MASVVGLVRAGLLLASVMVFDHGMAVVVDQQASDPQQAAATWLVIEPVAEALGGSGGDLLGGVWFLLVSGVALRSRVFPRALNWLGLGVGAAALLSAVPGLGVLEVAFEEPPPSDAHDRPTVTSPNGGPRAAEVVRVVSSAWLWARAL